MNIDEALFPLIYVLGGISFIPFMIWPIFFLGSRIQPFSKEDNG